ncbi:DUF5701 family protein [Isoptericola sp. S6320L]|uniref:DUF5701 family protein n=1 Tax=Isoptericola sp. S6320L TaxID=2926411 RepID=UPI001FF0FC3B|nr:DUF5701 family protein [Isoptericola sp. S6320L]MCK0115626.1 DUF5701 family protein [Isoptericola sp. S6320L]
MPAPLPALTTQADRLAALGLLPDDGPLDAAALRSAAAHLATHAPDGSLLVVHPRHLRPSTLAPHLTRSVRTRSGTVDREGFVVVDMADADEFAPTGLEEPLADVYAVVGPDRGDDLANWSPAEAAPELERRGRSPLTLAEGLHWVLQAPDALERNRCFMTIGSRLRKADGTFDTRTPAVWISNGTGRDGSQRRGAAKVGWCWWGNRHTWLGFASAVSRVA